MPKLVKNSPFSLTFPVQIHRRSLVEKRRKTEIGGDGMHGGKESIVYNTIQMGVLGFCSTYVSRCIYITKKSTFKDQRLMS